MLPRSGRDAGAGRPASIGDVRYWDSGSTLGVPPVGIPLLSGWRASAGTPEAAGWGATSCPGTAPEADRVRRSRCSRACAVMRSFPRWPESVPNPVFPAASAVRGDRQGGSEAPIPRHAIVVPAAMRRTAAEERVAGALAPTPAGTPGSKRHRWKGCLTRPVREVAPAVTIEPVMDRSAGAGGSHTRTRSMAAHATAVCE